MQYTTFTLCLPWNFYSSFRARPSGPASALQSQQGNQNAERLGKLLHSAAFINDKMFAWPALSPKVLCSQGPTWAGLTKVPLFRSLPTLVPLYPTSQSPKDLSHLFLQHTSQAPISCTLSQGEILPFFLENQTSKRSFQALASPFPQATEMPFWSPSGFQTGVQKNPQMYQTCRSPGPERVGTCPLS